MTDDREELSNERDRLEAKLSELGAAVEAIQAEIDTIETDADALVWERNTAAKRLLPDDRAPDSVSNETRGDIASYLDALGEKRDVRSDAVERKTDRLAAERKHAADARDDIDEISAAIDRIEDRTDNSDARVEEAIEALAADRSRLEGDLADLAARFEAFGLTLSGGTLESVIGDEIPEKSSEIQASLERIRSRIAELSARKVTVAADREKLQSIAGGGTCPTCNQNVGPERNENEADALEAELDEIQRHLGATRQERDELIARLEELTTLRDRTIALASFRSETVAGAAGRLEDRRETLEGHQADLAEERGELADAKAARDDADVAIATLESEIDDIETEIDVLQGTTTEGKSILETFRTVDELRATLEGRVGKLTELQAAYAETESALASIESEIEGRTDA